MVTELQEQVIGEGQVANKSDYEHILKCNEVYFDVGAEPTPIEQQRREQQIVREAVYYMRSRTA